MRDIAALRHLALTSGAVDRPKVPDKYCCEYELPKCLRGAEAGLSRRVAGLLSPSMIDASVHRSRSSLRAAACRAIRGKALNIAVFSDSNACGHGCHDANYSYADSHCAWPARLEALLGSVRGSRAQSVRVTNLCHPGYAVVSFLHLGIDRLLQINPDVLIIESALNENHLDEHYKGKPELLLQANEVLIRAALKRGIAVVYLELLTPLPTLLADSLWKQLSTATGSKYAALVGCPGRYGHGGSTLNCEAGPKKASLDENVLGWARTLVNTSSPDSVDASHRLHARIAEYYDLELISHRDAAWTQYSSEWLREVEAPPRTHLDSGTRCWASTRPYMTGHAPWWVHTQLAMLVAARWLTHLQSCAADPKASLATSAATPALPPEAFALRSGGLGGVAEVCEGATMSLTADAAFRRSGGGDALVPEGTHAGWRLFEDREGKPGWIHEGSTPTGICFRLRCVPRSAVQLSYLRSYPDTMGRATATVLVARRHNSATATTTLPPECGASQSVDSAQVDFDSRWEHRTSLTQILSLSQPGDSSRERGDARDVWVHVKTIEGPPKVKLLGVSCCGAAK